MCCSTFLRRILLCVVVVTPGLLASDTEIQVAQSVLAHHDTPSAFHSTNDNPESVTTDDAVHTLEERGTSEGLPQTQMMERRMDHHEVTHGTHLNPQYYHGKNLGKYYDCALQGPWKPIHVNYPERAPSADGGGGAHSIIQHHHNHPPTNHHLHDQIPVLKNHGGNAFGTNYVEEWDQRLKEVLQGAPLRTHGGGGHRGVAIDVGHSHHHGGGPTFGSVTGGYKVAPGGFGGGDGGPFGVWEDLPEDHLTADIIHGHHKGAKGVKGVDSFLADFPYEFESSKLPEWINEQPYDGSASNDKPFGGFIQGPVKGEGEYPGQNAFDDAVKNVGDIRYTHAIFGLVDPEANEGDDHREGAASQGYHGDSDGGHGEETEGDYHHGGASSEEEEHSGANPQGHAAPAGGGGAFRTGEGYAVEEVQSDEGAEQPNPSGDYASGSAVDGLETDGDFNEGKTGDFIAPNAVEQHQPQPSGQSSQSGTQHGGGNDVQVVTHPFQDGILGGIGGHHIQAPQGIHQYDPTLPRCPYAHGGPVLPHAVSVSNVIHSLPYDEGLQTNHLQFMMPPKLQHHVKLGSVLPMQQYEVHENQEESENKETVVDGQGRPNRIPQGYRGGERPLSDASAASIPQHGSAGVGFAEANKVVDGFPPKEGGDDFLRPPPLLVTDHYVKGSGNFKGFSDGRRKRRPVGRPSSHSGMPYAALFKRPPPLMMRTRPMFRGPVKRVSYS
ncbi:uncharacterized protein LOC124158957 isoform X2 [Ischnura elegans]|uniref:uncharacterized protein LOC124158957 isoform X2 n=1 Tax=Ischnura elegans TaxID=197161 RepID=UPI001ED896DF|nr:uncharacterized protein LOC124158957 isoform X2 [Ischnura elegans]